jgi:uncharacterized protein
VAERPAWLRDGPGGLEMVVHVRPGASRSAIAGVHGGALCVRVVARPVEGAANRELLRVLAEALGLRPSALDVRRGARGPDKRIVVEGVSEAEILARVTPLLR